MIVFTAKKESKMNDDEWRMEQSVSVSGRKRLCSRHTVKVLI